MVLNGDEVKKKIKVQGVYYDGYKDVEESNCYVNNDLLAVNSTNICEVSIRDGDHHGVVILKISGVEYHLRIW